MTDVNRRLRFLTISSIASWSLLAVVLFSGLTRSPARSLSVTELDAERIRILSPEGVPVMVMGNRDQLPGPMMDGHEYPRSFVDGRDMQSGIIFFNEQGDEVGGLVYNGFTKEDDGYWAGGHFSFDQWKQNQVVAMQYLDNSHTRRAGLRVWDRPTDQPLSEFFDTAEAFVKSEKGTARRDSLKAKMQTQRENLGVERLFIGSQDETAQLQLRDANGDLRARFYVNSDNTARLEFLDADGSVIAAYPENR